MMILPFTRDRTRWEPESPLGPIFFFLSYYIFYFVVGLPYKTLKLSFSSISLVNVIKIATIQPKNLTKTKNIHNGDCILAKKKKLFYHQRTKKSYVIGEAKAKFFVTTVNWYKYQLTVTSC